MRLGRRASLLIVFSLLTPAATAYAECPCVLWEERPLRSGQWRIATVLQPSFDRKLSCEERARTENNSEFDRLHGAQPGEKLSPPSAIFKCLPDTVDPRGPKGK